jgi:hypothetical protein
MTGARPARRGVLARPLRAYRALQARQRRLERRLERRYPRLYDARHAATGIGRAMWPLVGPVLMALLVLPILAVLAALVAMLHLHAPSVDLPAVDLPSIPLPDVDAPAWLTAVGHAIAAFFSVVGTASRYVVLALAAILGVRRTREVRRKRTAAERIGRPELLRRLAVTLSTVEARARAQNAATVRAASVREDRRKAQ